MKHERIPITANKLSSVSDEVGYLAYIAGPNGRYLSSKEFAAPDDKAAIELARKLGECIELWTRDGRFVVKLRPTTNAK
jgi:hypothetical protein